MDPSTPQAIPPSPQPTDGMQAGAEQTSPEPQTEPQIRLPRDGDMVQNINPVSRYYRFIGTFKRYLPGWTFGKGPGCDVAYPGETGPYGYPYVAQSAADLQWITTSEGRQAP